VRLLLRAAAFVLGATIVPILVLRWVPPVTTAFMLERQVGALFRGEDPGIRYRWVGWREIPPAMRLAVVAAEDQKFPMHWGFDFKSIADAAEENERRERPRGASTISQQVAKNLFLWPQGGWVRKGLEAYATVWIELLWPKRRILEVYLNVAELGDRVYGVGAASDRFFGKPPSRLTPRQAAIFASVLPSPRRFHADRPSPHVARRADWVERQMTMLGPGYLASLEGGGRGSR
jgi:monofunctional biosynthetic peptidoglycan transglycosylase